MKNSLTPCKFSRSVTAPNFARQLAEQRRDAQQPPTKRFRSSAAPKGTKLPSGYQDRAQLRNTDTDTNTGAGSGPADLEQRIAALEELVKKGQIEQATFEKLRAELGVGGDVQSTHMVKGLDWDLLKRMKAGDDVNKAPEKPANDEEKAGEDGEGDDGGELDLEAEFERVTEQKGQEELAPAAPREKKEKKGTMAPPPQKKSRNDILKELKASRAAAAAAQPSPSPAEPVLGSKFKKLSDSTKPEKKRWVEQDESGRRKEILATTDAQGKTKRKTRWLDKPGEPSGLLMPDKGAKPLGMDVPAEVAAKAAAAAAAAAPEDEDDDIFEGVGADYNPLADIGDDDSSSESDEAGEVTEPTKLTPTEPSAEPFAEKPVQPARPRNYFSTTTSEATEADEDQTRANPLTRDPNLLAAFKRAAALRQGETDDKKEKDDSRGQRFLEEMRRREAQDAMDMDLGFGGSRIEDEAEEEPVALEGEGSSRGGQKRKRGPKKRKGDKENVSDVLEVLEARK